MSEACFEQILARLAPSATLLECWRLSGGVSAQTTALAFRRADGRRERVVIRQPRHARQGGGSAAAEEFRLLKCLRDTAVIAPLPVYLDESLDVLPSPYLVVGYIDGEPEFRPQDLDDHIDTMARQLAQIHTVDVSGAPWSFLLPADERAKRTLLDAPLHLDDTIGEGRIRDALNAVWPWPAHNASVLLHGDFWPGNVLWRAGRLVAVIDWEDAGLGDPLADLAIARLDLLWEHGHEAMVRFTERYRALTNIDCRNLPHWDLCAALRPAHHLVAWARDSASLLRMQTRLEDFVDQAIAELLLRSS